MLQQKRTGSNIFRGLLNNVLTQSSAAALASGNIERPKVAHNSATGKYVMWMHKELATDYTQARVAVAVSDTIDGNDTAYGVARHSGKCLDVRDASAANDARLIQWSCAPAATSSSRNAAPDHPEPCPALRLSAAAE